MTRPAHHRYVSFLAALVFFLTGGAVTTAVFAAVPPSMSYQAYLTDPVGSPIDADVDVTFNLYTFETAVVPIWDETQTVTVVQGLFSTELGADPFNPFPAGAFDTPLWVGIAVGGDAEMAPRRLLTSAPYSLKSDDADTLQGYSAADLNQSAHVIDFDNPHEVTAAQAAAVPSATFATHESDDSAHHVRPSTFSDLSGQLADSQIPASIARDAELTWDNLHGIPAGFADGTDALGGDITGVIGVQGIDDGGGGWSGDVTLGLQAPLALPDDVLLGSGNVGIGLSNPNRPLYVVDDTAGLGYALKLDNPHAGIGSTGVGMLFSTGGGGPARGKGGLAYVSTDTWNRGAFHFLQDPNTNTAVPDLNDAVMTIANNGNVGVGTTSPAARLDLRGNSATYMSVDSGSTGSSGYRFEKAGLPRWTVAYLGPDPSALSVRKDNMDGTASDVLSFRTGFGQVGIGSIMPATTLDVAGNVKISGDIEVGGIMSFPSMVRYLTIPASDFVPSDHDSNWAVIDNKLINQDIFSDLIAYAPVHLPQGAELISFATYWIDRSGENGWADLYIDLNTPIAETNSYWHDLGEEVVRTARDTTIDPPLIDNARVYFLNVHLPNTDQVMFLSARIDYRMTAN